MIAAINAWTFPAELSVEQQLAAAASAGFGGIELTVEPEGPLCFDTPMETCAALARQAAERGVRVVGLATGEFWDTNYGSPDEATRQRAIDLTIRMLDRAAELAGETVLVVPAVVGDVAQLRPNVSYADALHRTFDALCKLRHEAESRAVAIAVENVWNRFLLSPVEAAELLDRVNSPYVGWHFDTGNVMAHGYPEDWIATLGGRIKAVHVKDYDLSRSGMAGFCELGEGSVDWPGVVGALRDVGYQGSMIYEGKGEPGELCRRLKNIIDGRPPI